MEITDNRKFVKDQQILEISYTNCKIPMFTEFTMLEEIKSKLKNFIRQIETIESDTVHLKRKKRKI